MLPIFREKGFLLANLPNKPCLFSVFYFCPIVLSWTFKMLIETCSVWNLVLGFSLHRVILVKIDWNVHIWKYHETSLWTLLWNICFHSGGHICWWSVKQVHLTSNTRLLLTQEEAVRMYLGFFPHRAAYSPMKIVFFTSVVRFIQYRLKKKFNTFTSAVQFVFTIHSATEQALTHYS